MKKNRFWVAGLFGIVLFATNSYSANPWIEGVVSEIVDGDTLQR